ncbi:hypothetical protein AXF42_Ash013800 [Apostasia shenzhenica]|uniref:Uncharacterized protein n=1 Tax=Apostasia shenzhenica TaxID=1088818 RepID=A0A2I0A4W8_9ASPA|nr:hypothetical protein AXF42_Ash013800 [Apostasia shenzhenica]
MPDPSTSLVAGTTSSPPARAPRIYMASNSFSPSAVDFGSSSFSPTASLSHTVASSSRQDQTRASSKARLCRSKNSSSGGVPP